MRTLGGPSFSIPLVPDFCVTGGRKAGGGVPTSWGAPASGAVPIVTAGNGGPYAAAPALVQPNKTGARRAGPRRACGGTTCTATAPSGVRECPRTMMTVML